MQLRPIPIAWAHAGSEHPTEKVQSRKELIWCQKLRKKVLKRRALTCRILRQLQTMKLGEGAVD